MFPKPKNQPRYNAATSVKTFPDGREVCLENVPGRREYADRKRLVWVLYGKRCVLCGAPLRWAQTTADHVLPRGMGGATHDDRVQNLVPACGVCNNEKGSKRVPNLRERQVMFLKGVLEWGPLTDEQRAAGEKLLVTLLDLRAKEEATDDATTETLA